MGPSGGRCCFAALIATLLVASCDGFTPGMLAVVKRSGSGLRAQRAQVSARAWRQQCRGRKI